MTPTEFIEWLDMEIADAIEIGNMAKDTETVKFWQGKEQAFQKVKRKFLTLTPPPTTLS